MCPYQNMTKPVLCRPGYYCPGGKEELCPVGTYNNQTGVNEELACIDCPKGKYCEGLGNENPTGSCDAGFFCEGGATSRAPIASTANATKYPRNGPCPTGSYCPSGISEPRKCPQGTFRNITGGMTKSNCYLCTSGSYCSSEGLTSVTGMCYGGWYCPPDYANAEPTPHNFTCPVGHFCPNGTVLPKECEAGMFAYFFINLYIVLYPITFLLATAITQLQLSTFLQ